MRPPATAQLSTVVLTLLLAGAAPRPAGAASSRDYPGPCLGEVNASGVPLYLSADYRGANPVFGVVILSAAGRFKLGISCVATGFVVVRVGPDSALCTVRGRCTPSELMALTPEDIEAVRFIPNQVPFFHICRKHGFGWYDAVNVPPGIYVAAAMSQSALWGLVEGHGTMDTYAFTGNGGAFEETHPGELRGERGKLRLAHRIVLLGQVPLFDPGPARLRKRRFECQDLRRGTGRIGPTRQLQQSCYVSPVSVALAREIVFQVIVAVGKAETALTQV